MTSASDLDRFCCLAQDVPLLGKLKNIRVEEGWLAGLLQAPLPTPLLHSQEPRLDNHPPEMSILSLRPPGLDARYTQQLPPQQTRHQTNPDRAETHQLHLSIKSNYTYILYLPHNLLSRNSLHFRNSRIPHH